ncbi:RNA 2'-phosphotransferase, Tpt1/KptA family protein [Toxoplasma gondii MAS]|uniref:2'-phosphotransferase n=1 Tax=Toxoplasma gondii MAS TaxID=943118 RepID=A0A086PX39_TOXGO|nr:RNA 2'-phosphotransferase, Tpt1/KptA family protein [Toxoplasma gondii MAS]
MQERSPVAARPREDRQEATKTQTENGGIPSSPSSSSSSSVSSSSFRPPAGSFSFSSTSDRSAFSEDQRLLVTDLSGAPQFSALQHSKVPSRPPEFSLGSAPSLSSHDVLAAPPPAPESRRRSVPVMLPLLPSSPLYHGCSSFSRDAASQTAGHPRRPRWFLSSPSPHLLSLLQREASRCCAPDQPPSASSSSSASFSASFSSPPIASGGGQRGEVGVSKRGETAKEGGDGAEDERGRPWNRSGRRDPAGLGCVGLGSPDDGRSKEAGFPRAEDETMTSSQNAFPADGKQTGGVAARLETSESSTAPAAFRGVQEKENNEEGEDRKALDQRTGQSPGQLEAGSEQQVPTVSREIPLNDSDSPSRGKASDVSVKSHIGDRAFPLAADGLLPLPPGVLPGTEGSSVSLAELTSPLPPALPPEEDASWAQVLCPVAAELLATPEFEAETRDDRQAARRLDEEPTGREPSDGLSLRERAQRLESREAGESADFPGDSRGEGILEVQRRDVESEGEPQRGSETSEEDATSGEDEMWTEEEDDEARSDARAMAEQREARLQAQRERMAKSKAKKKDRGKREERWGAKQTFLNRDARSDFCASSSDDEHTSSDPASSSTQRALLLQSRNSRSVPPHHHSQCSSHSSSPQASSPRSSSLASGSLPRHLSGASASLEEARNGGASASAPLSQLSPSLLSPSLLSPSLLSPSQLSPSLLSPPQEASHLTEVAGAEGRLRKSREVRGRKTQEEEAGEIQQRGLGHLYDRGGEERCGRRKEASTTGRERSLSAETNCMRMSQLEMPKSPVASCAYAGLPLPPVLPPADALAGLLGNPETRKRTDVSGRAHAASDLVLAPAQRARQSGPDLALRLSISSVASDGECVSFERRSYLLIKKLNFILRHGAPLFKLPMREDGYVRIRELLELDCMRSVSWEEIYLVVASNFKRRYEICYDPTEPEHVGETGDLCVLDELRNPVSQETMPPAVPATDDASYLSFSPTSHHDADRKAARREEATKNTNTTSSRTEDRLHSPASSFPSSFHSPSTSSSASFSSSADSSKARYESAAFPEDASLGEKSLFSSLRGRQAREGDASGGSGGSGFCDVPAYPSSAAPELANDRWLLRATQGHTIRQVASDLLLRSICDPGELPVCVHGTFLKNWMAIRSAGLSRMHRNHIHFAPGLPSECGVVSGMRRSSDVAIYVNVHLAMKEGVRFYVSNNNVILTEGLRGKLVPRYFKRAIHLRWNEVLFEDGCDFTPRFFDRLPPELLEEHRHAVCAKAVASNHVSGSSPSRKEKEESVRECGDRKGQET